MALYLRDRVALGTDYWPSGERGGFSDPILSFFPLHSARGLR